MPSNVTPMIPTPLPAPRPAATVPLWRVIRARLGEASTWAGIGGILLVSLNLLPAALPQFHAALTQQGWARMTGLTVALLSFVVAVARREGNTTVAAIAQAAEVVVEHEKTRATISVV